MADLSILNDLREHGQTVSIIESLFFASISSPLTTKLKIMTHFDRS